jgi:hypothetical protein
MIRAEKNKKTDVAFPNAHPGLPDFSWCKYTKTGKRYQMTTNYTQRSQNMPTFSIPRPSKFTQIGIFGMQICKPSGNHTPIRRSNKIKTAPSHARLLWQVLPIFCFYF